MNGSIFLHSESINSKCTHPAAQQHRSQDATWSGVRRHNTSARSHSLLQNPAQLISLVFGSGAVAPSPGDLLVPQCVQQTLRLVVDQLRPRNQVDEPGHLRVVQVLVEVVDGAQHGEAVLLAVLRRRHSRRNLVLRDCKTREGDNDAQYTRTLAILAVNLLARNLT